MPSCIYRAQRKPWRLFDAILNTFERSGLQRRTLGIQNWWSASTPVRLHMCSIQPTAAAMNIASLLWTNGALPPEPPKQSQTTSLAPRILTTNNASQTTENYNNHITPHMSKTTVGYHSFSASRHVAKWSARWPDKQVLDLCSAFTRKQERRKTIILALQRTRPKRH